MIRNRFYYSIKPLVPPSLRMTLRRWFALRMRETVRDIWPIMRGSEAPPEAWPGWPGGKQFALILTHDVEGRVGLQKCRELMNLEKRLGFCSSFTLIPQGEYSSTTEFRQELVDNGFEVGVHDLYHNGKLFLSKSEFIRNVPHINRHLKEWGAKGFRSGFMLHNLEWLHELDIEYDLSTFDTDPFEPQPQGRHTIFPFWVPRPAHGGNGRRGYVEMPYTLPQDSTLFLLLGERQPDIWFQKLDWIAKHGGMVLLDAHPDYMAFGEGCQNGREYPVDFYIRLLEYIRSKYAGAYWHALPREVAQFVRDSCPQACAASRATSGPVILHRKSKPKIWVDLDNTPHVPFFEPVLEELRARGFPLLVTARDAFQVCELADKKALQYVRIGRHYGKNRLVKGFGLVYRALQLAPLVIRERPALALSHGARSQLILSNWLRIPSVLIEDYEYCQFPLMMKPTWLMAPDVIPDAALCLTNGKLRKYPGIKEDVYAWKLHPDPDALKELGLTESDIIVTVRPPATEAHYHNPEGEKLFQAFMIRACQTPHTKVVLLPRNKKQAEVIRQRWPAWFENDKTVIPESAINGLNLIWHSDLVVSGGGTMNREAAAVGVPVYSIFRGSIGAVDRSLEQSGRLFLVESTDDVARKIRLEKRSRKPFAETTSRKTMIHIVDMIEELAESTLR
jgi:predicted glycosyltransferase